MTLLLMWCSSYLQGKQLQVFITKLLISTCIFPFQNLSFYYVVWYQVIQSCTCKYYVKTCNSWKHHHSKILPFTPIVTLKEHIIVDYITSHNPKEDICKSHYKSIGLALQLVLTKVMARVVSMFLACIFFYHFGARQIFRILKQKS